MKSTLRGCFRIMVIAGCVAAGFFEADAQVQAAPPPAEQAPHPWRRADSGAAVSGAQSLAPVENQTAVPENTQPQNAAEPNAWPDPQSAAAPQNGLDSQAAQQPQPGNAPAPQQAPDNPQASQPPYNPGAGYGNYSIPATLTIAPGTYITARVNGWLSSDRNQPGDAFTATLAEPLIVNGVVVAQRGQTVGGVVTEAKKAGLVEGTSRLGIKLTDITLVDGQKISLQTSVIGRTGDTSVGRDAAAVGGTTALGAAIGAGVDWGRGAAIGAGAGAAAGLIGVLLTRGHPTVVYPETALTFRVDAPATVDTTHAPQAFRYADQTDYGPAYTQAPPPARRPATPCYGCAPAPYYGPAYYPYYAPYPYYWGTGFAFYVGPRFYYPRYYYPGFYAGRVWVRRR